MFGFLPGPGWTFVRAGGVPTDFVLHMMDEPVGDPGLAVIGVVNDGSIAVLANNGAGRALATQVASTRMGRAR